MHRKAIIFGIKGYNLTANEKTLIKKVKPWGIMIFSRNIKNIIQLKNLIKNIRKILKDKNYPILIDQEGGKVSRLNSIIDLSTFSQNFFGTLYRKNRKLFFYFYKIYINCICEILIRVGININTVPVLDIRRKNSHNIIGDRSFSKKSNDVIVLGKLFIDAYHKNRIATVVKHIPGHGLAKSDSHKKTPIIKSSKKELISKDFRAFRECKSFFAMTAHVIYSKYDSSNTVTHSKIVIRDIIRKHIKFNGILISDDISMKSLKYSIEENAERAIKAGCNLILHCNGNLNEMYKLAKVIPRIDKFTQKKTSHFYKFLR